MSEWTPAKIRALVILLGVLIASLGIAFYRRGRAVEADLSISPPAPAAPLAKKQTPTAQIPAPSVPEQSQPIVVHVAGDVAKPGVYRLPPDARVEDAVKAAGGANESADVNSLNLAAPVQDGSRVYVPVKGETLPATSAQNSGSRHRHSSQHAAKFTHPGKESINVNTASADQLQRLPGVGPAMAARIVQYRKETGAFTDPEQLMEVSGIGPKKFARMKPFVRVRGPALQGAP